METRKKDSCPPPNIRSQLSMKSIAWNIFIGSLGLAAWLCSLKNISVLNVLLVLCPKHSSYLEENSFYPSQKSGHLSRWAWKDFPWQSLKSPGNIRLCKSRSLFKDGKLSDDLKQHFPWYWRTLVCTSSSWHVVMTKWPEITSLTNHSKSH